MAEKKFKEKKKTKAKQEKKPKKAEKKEKEVKKVETKPTKKVEEKPRKEKAKEPEEKPTEEVKKPVAEEKKPRKIEKITLHRFRELTGEEAYLLKKKPKFFRQELYKLKRLKDKWRRPTGIDSKKIEGKRGKGELPSIGYKKPKKVSGLSSGFVPVIVHTLKDLNRVNPAKNAAIISAGVGRKKRNMIITKANTLGVTILNPRKGEL